MPDQEKTLREQIEEAMNPPVEEAEPEVEAEPEDEENDPEAADAVEEEGEQEEEAAEAAPEPDIPPPPTALKGDIKAKWQELPPEVRNEFVRLESTQAKGMQKIAEDANFGRSLKQVVQPYEAMLRAEGATAEKAVASLLNTAYQLRTAAPAQKQKLFSDLARQYGVDVKGLSSEEAKPIDPNVQYLQQEVNQLRQSQTQWQQAQQQAQESALMGGIEQFAADPQHEHFESVQDAVVRLIEPFSAGEAITPEAVQQRLQKAYDQACWAIPEIRQQILTKQRAEEEAERQKREKARLEAKKNAGASVTGRTAKSSAGKLSDDMSLRDIIAAQVNGTAQRI